MQPLIDGDIIRYEIGFAAEAGIRHSSGDLDALPSWDYVEAVLDRRMQEIEEAVGATCAPIVFLTDAPTFRDQVACTKEYKGGRSSTKPWHFANITAYLECRYQVEREAGLEADDLMAIRQTLVEDQVICSRDKDLKQVPGWLYSWELGKQPKFGPTLITKAGDLSYDKTKGKISGTGYAWFCAQLLMGDTTDNIPGIKGVGPAAAYEFLRHCTKPKHYLDNVKDVYRNHAKDNWERYLLEQGQLLWMVRRYNSDGTPELWSIDQYE